MKGSILARPNLKLFVLAAILLLAVQDLLSRGQSNVTIRAHGPRSSLYTLTAVALEETAKAELHESLSSLKQIIEDNWGVNQAPEMFCFGLLESFDVDTLITLAGPDRVSRFPKGPLVQGR